MIRSGGRAADRLQRGIAAADDLRLGVAAAFERVLDQAGDVLLVFDNQDAVFGHSLREHAYRLGRFADGIEAVKCGLRSGCVTSAWPSSLLQTSLRSCDILRRVALSRGLHA